MFNCVKLISFIQEEKNVILGKRKIKNRQGNFLLQVCSPVVMPFSCAKHNLRFFSSAVNCELY